MNPLLTVSYEGEGIMAEFESEFESFSICIGLRLPILYRIAVDQLVVSSGNVSAVLVMMSSFISYMKGCVVLHMIVLSLGWFCTLRHY